MGLLSGQSISRGHQRCELGALKRRAWHFYDSVLSELRALPCLGDVTAAYYAGSQYELDVIYLDRRVWGGGGDVGERRA